jgi:hypothetical protein
MIDDMGSEEGNNSEVGPRSRLASINKVEDLHKSQSFHKICAELRTLTNEKSINYSLTGDLLKERIDEVKLKIEK